MLSIRSSADMARALDGPMDPGLRRLLTLRRDQLLDRAELDLGDLVHIIVVCRGDTLAAVEAVAGFPLTGDDAPLEWVERHSSRWIEVAAILTDVFSVAIFVPDCVTTVWPPTPCCACQLWKRSTRSELMSATVGGPVSRPALRSWRKNACSVRRRWHSAPDRRASPARAWSTSPHQLLDIEGGDWLQDRRLGR